jgi:hypothetical protein
MCDPLTAFLLIAGTGLTAYGQKTAADQQEANLNFQAKQGEADAKAAQGEAIVEAERIRKASKSQRAQATAAAAASGVDVSSPTALKIDEEIVKNSEEDALLTILNGADTSKRLQQQAAIDKQGAKLAGREGNLAVAGTLLSGGAKLNSAWKKGNT